MSPDYDLCQIGGHSSFHSILGVAHLSKQHLSFSSKSKKVLRVEPVVAGWEARVIPLCNATSSLSGRKDRI